MQLKTALRTFGGAVLANVSSCGRGAVLLVAAGAVLEGTGIMLLVPILSMVIGDVRHTAQPAPAWLPAGVLGLGVLLAAFLALMAVRAAVLYRREVALITVQTGFVAGVRNRVITALTDAPWDRVAMLRHARVTNLLGADIARIAQASHLLIQGAVAAAMLVVQIGIGLVLSPILAGGVTVVLLIGLTVTILRVRWAHDVGAALVKTQLRLLHDTTGFLGGLKAAKAEDNGARFVADFASVQAEMSHHQIAFVRRQARGRAVFGLASAAGAAAVVGSGVMMSVPGTILAALILLFARMAGPVAALQAAVQNIVFGLPSFAAVCMLEADLRDDAPHPAPRLPPPGPIVLKDVRFVHPGGDGLTAATLTLAPGEIIGLSGPSGAGKTTLVDLIAGLIAPQAGTIRIGGAPLDAALQAGWRRCVSYVAQDGFLLHASVRDNLTQDQTTDDAAVAAVLAITGADRVVARLPDGLDTIVGERGARLSGGERQRLAIARALLRRPRLLVLDEATNALDIDAEAAVLDRLTDLAPRPTIVIVAHRPDSLRCCDRIVLVNAGVVQDTNVSPQGRP